MRIRVLGTAGIEGASLAGRDRRVLAALVLSGSRSCPADRLAEALYGDDPPPTWRKVVQGSVLRLRRALGPLAIDTTPDGYRLTVGDDEVDARRFDRLLREATDLIAGGEPERAAVVLASTLALVAGEPYGDLVDWEPGRAESARLSEAHRGAEERRVEALIAGGQLADAISEAAALVEREPLREQRWSVLALAQYRNGRQGDALRSIARARRVLADQLGVDPGPDLIELERSILAHDDALLDTATTASASPTCPYKGLVAYEPEDASMFFGRRSAIDDGLARVSSVGALAIVGASGSGKSSLARAGIVPALDRPGRPAVVITPGSDPCGALRAVPPGATVVVDQLEELFTLGASAAARDEFARSLAERRTVAPIVVTMRADHLGALAEVPPLAQLVESSLLLLGPMDDDDLRGAIEGPAAAAGLKLEPGLVELLLRDVRDQPGSLPLLSHALTETWTRREARTLTTAGYLAGGGVHGAVAQTAERVVDQLPPDGLAIARGLFLRLVHLVDDGEPVRQRLPRSALAPGADTQVVEALVRARLLTADADTIEMAHESLARTWPRLRGWLDDDREGQRTLLHLSAASQEWEARGRDGADLYRGARLAGVEELIDDGRALTPVELAFVDASNAQQRLEQEDLRARAARLRRLLRTVAAVAVVAVLLGVAAVVQTRRETADRDRARAAQTAAEATARAAGLRVLVDNAATQGATKRELGALLAVAAYRLDPSAASRGALLRTFTSSPGYAGSIPVNGGSSIVGNLLPDGQTLAVVDIHMGVHLIDITSGAEVGALAPMHDSTDGDVITDLSADGRYLALATDGPSDPNVLRVWDLTTRQPRFADQTLDFPFGAVAFSPDGSLLAISGGPDAVVQVRSAVDGSLVDVVPSLPRPADAHYHGYTAALRFLPDGTLAIGSQSGVIRIVDPRTGTALRTLAGPAQTSEVVLRLSPDGGTVYGVGFGGTEAWDLASGATLWHAPATGGCNDIVPAPVIGALLCAHADSQVEALDLATGVALGTRFDYQLAVDSGLVIGDGGKLLIEIGGPRVALWRLDGSSLIDHRVIASPGATPNGFDGPSRLLVNRPDGGPELLDASNGTVIDPLDGVVAAAITDDPARLGALFADGTSGLYDVEQHARVPGLEVVLPFVPTIALRQGHELVLMDDSDVQGIDLSTLHLVPPRVRGGPFYGLTFTPDGQHVFTGEHDGLHARDGQGKPTGQPVLESASAVAGKDVLVDATFSGRLLVLDPTTLQSAGPELPSVTGLTTDMFLSDDSSELLVEGQDRTVHLADMATRQWIGDPVPMGGGPTNIVVFRGDGGSAAFADAAGVTAWDLDADHLLAAACQFAGRNLTRAEWTTYVGDLASYQQVCPGQPASG